MRPTTSGSSARPTPLLTSKTESTNYVVHGNHNAVNPAKTGTKSAAHYQLNVGAGQDSHHPSAAKRLAPAAIGDPFKSFAEIMQTRHREADEFYKSITPERVSEDEALVMRQALAGMLWSKQYFFFDVDNWLDGTWYRSD